MTLKYIWRSFQPSLSFSRPFQLSLACFRVARSPDNSWASCRSRLGLNSCSCIGMNVRISIKQVWVGRKFTTRPGPSNFRPGPARFVIIVNNWLCLSVRMSVCLSQTSKLLLLFLFLYGIKPFLAVSSPWPLYKTVFFDFWFRSPNAQNLIPNMHKIDYKSACMVDRPEMFGPSKGFSGIADSMEPCKMLWGRPLLPRQRNLG